MSEPSRLEQIILDLKAKLEDKIGIIAMFQADAEHLVEAYYNVITDPSHACWMCSGSRCELQGLCGTHANQVIEEKNREITENEQAAQCWGDVLAGCDIERGGKLYRQVEVVKGPGKTQTEIELDETKAALELRKEKTKAILDELAQMLARNEYLAVENQRLEREMAGIRALRAHPMRLTDEELLARAYRRENRLYAQVAGLKIQVKRWAQKAKDLGAINRRTAHVKGAKS